MKLSCDSLDLSDALTQVGKALPLKKVMPILNGIKLKAEGDTLTLTATDLELSIEKKIKEFKSLFDSLPQKSYIYVCAGKKLKCIYYSDDSGSYGYNGNYSLRNYDCVFIYWSTQQIGNFIDGYI